MNEPKDSQHYSVFDMDRLESHYMIPIFEEITNKYTMKNILDYGCGNGVTGSYFKKVANSHLIGVDGSQYGLTQAKKRNYDEVFFCDDFNTQSIALSSNSMDFVLCKDVLEHLLNPIFVLNEINRILKNDGIALILIPNHFPLKYRIKFLFTNEIDTQKYFPKANQWDLPHLRFFTKSGIVKMLNKCGFEIIKDYSEYFATSIPILTNIKLVRGLEKYMAKRSSTHFSCAFTFLIKKCKFK